MPSAISFAGAVLLANAFVFALLLRKLTTRTKGRWQAISAGVTVAYVFVNIIPELEEHRPTIAASASAILDAEKKVYLWTLTGFVTFVALTRIPSTLTNPALAKLPYWCELVGYSLYTALIGYLLTHREDASVLSLGLFIFAMGLHLFLVDMELVDRFRGLYQPWGRIELMISVVVGWGLGDAHALPDSFTSRLFAFVVGAVLVMSAHEELPAAGERPFWWFAVGAFAYATLLMLI